jgi:hypothetical protein
MDDIEGAGKRALRDHRVGHSDWFGLVEEHHEIAGRVYRVCSLVRRVIGKRLLE